MSLPWNVLQVQTGWERIELAERRDLDWRSAALSLAVERVAEAARMGAIYP